jgi:hypothetical protein
MKILGLVNDGKAHIMETLKRAPDLLGTPVTASHDTTRQIAILSWREDAHQGGVPPEPAQQ